MRSTASISTQIQLKTIIGDFLEHMNKLGFISPLTGLIFSDPIYLGLSSEIVERGFIEKCIQTDGKNPMTREHMTLEDLQKIPSNLLIKGQIETEINKFLEENKSHPDFEEIKQALNEEWYGSYVSAHIQSAQHPAQPTDPTPDDLLAMGIEEMPINTVPTVHYTVASPQPPLPPNEINLPQNPVGWGVSCDNWSLYDSGGEINRYKVYINYNSNSVCRITLCGYRDDTFSIEIMAGYTLPYRLSFFRLAYATLTSIECNLQLIQTLQTYGINQNTANVTRFPNIDSRQNNLFLLRASLPELREILPTILDVVGILEDQNSILSIKDEIISLFQQNTFELNSPN